MPVTPLRGFALLFASTLALTAADTKTPPAIESWTQTREATFELVWRTVNDAYYDGTFGGLDWVAVGRKYRERLPGIIDAKELRGMLQAMLHEIGVSHLSIIPVEAAVFTEEERAKHGVLGTRIDVFEDRVILAEVDKTSPAAKAGCTPGVEVLELNGRPIAEVRAKLLESGLDAAQVRRWLEQWAQAQLVGPVGTSLTMTTRDSLGDERTWTLAFSGHAGAWSEPIGNFPAQPIDFETKLSEDGIAYLRFSSFSPPLMRQIRGFLRTLPKEAGLIIDLRGNPGGVGLMATGIAGYLVREEGTLATVRHRYGRETFRVYPQEGAFLGPVAVLIDESSASTSEILAAGLRDLGRARVFGERSAGAAMPSLFRRLPTGDLLQYVVADVQTADGRSIEGAGVPPDEHVAHTIDDIRSRRDPVLAAAEVWVRGARAREVNSSRDARKN